MNKPCQNNEDFCSCHICFLYKHNQKYRKLWGGIGDAIPGKKDVSSSKIVKEMVKRATKPCVHLGEKLELVSSCKVGCGGGTEKYRCSIFGECRKTGLDSSIQNCSRCDKYEPTPELSVDQYVEKLNSKIIFRPEDGSQWSQNQTIAVNKIIRKLRENLPEKPKWRGDKAIITTGGGKYWAGTFVQCCISRELGWDHPIQAWYLGEKEYSEKWISELKKLDVECVDAKSFQISDAKYRILNGFEVKLYAVANSRFSCPIWMDSDCYTSRNPIVAYQCREYQKNGSIHYPDLANAESWTKWEKWGVSPDDSPPIETGQFIYDLDKCWEEVQIALKYNEMSDLTYHWDYGDKGPARVAWALTKKPRTIYRKVPEWKGPAFIHIAFDEEPLFIHRCRGKVSGDQNGFYTPQHKDGQDYHDIPGEELYQKFLAKAKSIAK